MTTIRNVHLTTLDSTSPDELVEVEFGDTVAAIRPPGSTASDDTLVDGAGGYLMAGLIDTHLHLGRRDALVAAARAGITTVVDLGTHPDSVVEAQRGDPALPAILSAGSAASAPGSTQISMMGFSAESGVTDPADAERFLDWRTRHGADLVKIIVEDPAATDVPALDVATIAALVRGAQARGLLTVAHVVTAAAFDRGLDAGVDILTHAPLDGPLHETTLRRMVDQGTIASPTLVMMRAIAHARLGEHAEAAFATAVESVRAMHAAGVPIIAGTDANETPFAPVPHGSSLHDELGYLQQAGLTVEEALRAATSGAATALRLDDRGRVSEGSRADLVLIEDDPTARPEALRRPAGIWIGGVPVTSA